MPKMSQWDGVPRPHPPADKRPGPKALTVHHDEPFADSALGATYQALRCDPLTVMLARYWDTRGEGQRSHSSDFGRCASAYMLVASTSIWSKPIASIPLRTWAWKSRSVSSIRLAMLPKISMTR
jgi:hypothetical protein